MTRVTFGIYRAGVRDTGVTLGTAAGAGPPVTPFPTAWAAVARYHRDGWTSAWQQLDDTYRRSPYWGSGGLPPARGWANAMRACFRTYHRLAGSDNRPAFVTGIDRGVNVGNDELRLHVDVILLDSRGYVPRILLWDLNDLTRARATLYAAPVWSALEEELGAGRVPEVEVWHLRTATQFLVSATDAEAALPDVARVVSRLTGNP
jgi:hypothetical protein